MFIDIAKIKIKAGTGGDGSGSHYHYRRKRHIKPNGGSGGKGADIVFLADPKIHTLLDFRYRQHFSAKNGSNGGSQERTGKDAEDLIIHVPCGTLIIDAENGYTLRDLTNCGEKVIAAKGGQGGKGNSATKRDPQKGALGQEKEVSLELRLIADVAIVGLPNAGKSSLVSSISNARPKIGAYPFTTKAPILGVYESGETSFVLVDIPGLIEGAHLGRGLGDKFLRHIERTRLVVHLVDIAAESTNDPVKDYETINNELKLYGANLDKKPRIIVANKIDLSGWQANLKKLEDALGKRIPAISCLKKQGLEGLVNEIKRKL